MRDKFNEISMHMEEKMGHPFFCCDAVLDTCSRQIAIYSGYAKEMMPISWIDNGNLAFGGGNYAIYINPTTGKRFVDETSERDVLSLAEFRNGIEHNGTKGVCIEIANAEAKIPGPYLYGNEDVEWRQYVRTVDQLADLFTSLGLPTDAATVRETIENYDKAIMAGEQPEDVKKTNPNRLIGNAEKDENGMFTRVSGEYRVKNVMVGGQPLELDKTYTLASHNYMLLGHGDGYTMFGGCEVLGEDMMVDNQVLITYITTTLGGVVGEQYANPYGDGRIVAVE